MGAGATGARAAAVRAVADRPRFQAVSGTAGGHMHTARVSPDSEAHRTEAAARCGAQGAP
jgi:hypothetical protein